MDGCCPSRTRTRASSSVTGMRPWATRIHNDRQWAKLGKDTMPWRPTRSISPSISRGLARLQVSSRNHHIVNYRRENGLALRQDRPERTDTLTLDCGQDGVGIDLDALTTDLAFTLQALKQLSVSATKSRTRAPGLILARDDLILPAAMGLRRGWASAIARARKLDHLGDAPLEETGGRRSTSRWASSPGSMRGSSGSAWLLVGEKVRSRYWPRFSVRGETSRAKARGQVGVGDLLAALDESKSQIAAGTRAGRANRNRKDTTSTRGLDSPARLGG